MNTENETEARDVARVEVAAEKLANEVGEQVKVDVSAGVLTCETLRQFARKGIKKCAVDRERTLADIEAARAVFRYAVSSHDASIKAITEQERIFHGMLAANVDEAE